MHTCNLWCCSPDHGCVVFPLIPGTKEPAVKWRDAKRGQYHAVGNYGIALSADMLVLDFDPRNYPIGRDMCQEFFQRYPSLRTRIVQTPRGGYHVYLKKPPETKPAKKQAKWPGVDFLSEGHFVCGPGTQTVAGKDRGTGEYAKLGEADIAAIP